MKEKKYYSIYTQMKNKILCGEYKHGEKLPSKRVMADLSGCSMITVETAYGMLADEGYICARERSGYYVSLSDAHIAKAKSTGAAKIIYADDKDSDESADFEYSVWFRTVRKVIADDGEKLFRKSPCKGCAVLRNAIADYLLRYRGMLAQPENIIIGSGAEQLYETAVKLLGRSNVFGIEDPSYKQISTVYENMGIGIRRLKMAEDGIQSEYIEKNDFDVLHVTPFNSYPSGVTASASKRREYLLWAQKNGKYIIEDDFDSEFFLPGQPIEALYSLDGGDRVIYINTFSKSLSPSMRMGYMILPRQLLAEYERRLSGFSCTVPVMEQYVLAQFINDGSFERHLNITRMKLKKQKSDIRH